MYLVYKQLGETPLTALEKCRTQHGIEKNIPMTYAGRLDPMAEGLLIILTGEECKEKDAYVQLDKEYEFEILFGFSTDTGDLLGMVQRNQEYKNVLSVKDIEKILSIFGDSYIQKYPAYSSKTISGTPLFVYARENRMVKDLPTHEVSINNVKTMGLLSLSANDLEKKIVEKINSVQGDFRQKEILEKWKEVFLNKKQETFHTLSLNISVSSGFYVRQFVVDIGEKMGISCVTFSIKRIRIGEYKLT